MSDSHADDELRNELEKHLAALRHQRVIEIWDDRRIESAQDLKSCPSICRRMPYVPEGGVSG